MLHWILVESREAQVPRGWFLHMSFRKAEVGISAFLVTVQFSSNHLPRIQDWLVRSCTAPSALSFHLFLLHGFFLHSFRPQNGIPFSFSLPVKCLAQNFLCDLISGPSYEVLLLPVPLYLLPTFGCHI